MKMYLLKILPVLVIIVFFSACSLQTTGINQPEAAQNGSNKVNNSSDKEPENQLSSEETNLQDEEDPVEHTQITFINHAMPDAAVSPISLESVDCSNIREVPASIGGLTSEYGLAFCDEYKSWEEVTAAGEDDLLFQEGCRMSVFVSLLLEKNGVLIKMSSRAKLAEMFAPIDTPEKALAFAQAATGLDAYFDQGYDPEMRYLSETIEDSFAEKTEEGYRVLLYDFQVCGCGPHTTSAVEVIVSRDGEITTGKSIPMFEDPEMDGLCVD